jgi:uncharacterized protein YkwD
MTAFSRSTERRVARSGSRATVARIGLLVAIGLSIAVTGIALVRGFQPITDSQTDAALAGPPSAVPDTSLNLQTLLSANGSHPAGSYRTAPPAPAAAIDGSNFYLPLVQARDLSALEQALINAVNRERQAASLPALIVDAGLSHIALIRANQMVSQDYVGTVDPAGYSMFRELLARAGYTYTWAGENLDADNYSAEASPAAALAAFRADDQTRENVLSADYTRVGVGEVTAPDGRHLYAIVFVG